jgi:hypothetical protein
MHAATIIMIHGELVAACRLQVLEEENEPCRYARIRLLEQLTESQRNGGRSCTAAASAIAKYHIF